MVAGLENGRIFILDSTCYPIKCVNAKYDFVVTDASFNSRLSTLTTFSNSPRYISIEREEIDSSLSVKL